MTNLRKDYHCLLTLLFLIVFNSCEKSLSLELIDQNNNDELYISVEVINSENTLKFKDHETFINFVREINRKDEKEKLLFSLEKGIRTPYEIINTSDLELEEILNSSTSEVEFRTKYNIFKDKYKPHLLFNDEKDSDFSPYSKYINSELECIININGNYLIGDSLYTAPIYNNIDELMNNNVSYTRATVSNELNYAKAQTSSRRCEMWISMTGNDIYLRFVGKKKQWLGWFKNDMHFMGEYKLTSGSDYIPFEFYETAYFGYINDVYRNVDNQTFRITTKEYKELTVNFGRIKLVPPFIPSLTGRMEIWSSELNYNDRGIANVYLR